MAQERKRTVPVRKAKDGEPGAAAAEKKEPVRARKTAAKAEPTSAAAKPAAAKAGKAKTAAPKAASPKTTTAKRSTSPATTPKPRARRLQAVPEPSREEIAFRAYLLWEQGVPGGETEHWLRAEAELRAA